MGSAIPLQFYAGLSQSLLTNGFFARLLVIEAVDRGFGQSVTNIPLPADIAERATWWVERVPSEGNLATVYPEVYVADITPQAQALCQKVQRQCDEYYASTEPDDEPARALWARAYEKVRRLALVYACSEDHMEPCISEAGVQWAWAFAEHQTRRMLYMANTYVFENEFEERSQQLLDFLGDYPERWVPYWRVGRKFRGWTVREKEEIIGTLVNSRLLVDEPANPDHPGRTGRHLCLLSTGSEE